MNNIDCSSLSGRLRDICEGRSGLPARSVQAYIDRWIAEGRITVKKKPAGPGNIRRAANFAKAATKHVLNRNRLVSTKLYENRLQTCRGGNGSPACPLYDAKRDRCLHLKCGCTIAAKAKWESEDCPEKKWPKGEKEEPEAVEPPEPVPPITSIKAPSVDFKVPPAPKPIKVSARRRKAVKWAYGVTSVPARKDTLLPQTLASLSRAGFDRPRLFIDGAKDGFDSFGLDVTYRFPNVRTAGNWILTLWELYIREPNQDRYAIFQDDFVTVLNLREYLERVPYPDKGYLNLYTFPVNQELAPKNGRPGWYPSNQLGKGAVALVFSKDAVVTLLSSRHIAERPQNPQRGHRAIDGGIVESFRKAGWKEYVHNPSLVQHTGLTSSMGNRRHPLAESFPGEDFDALSFLQSQSLSA